MTSLEVAQFIQYCTYRIKNKMLNKTQINKILFYVYGVYLADNHKALFEEDKPKAWVYGPVFPRVYRKIDIYNIKEYTQEELKGYTNDKKFWKVIVDAIDKMTDKSAYYLTKWSHNEGSPWYETIYNGNEKRPWDSPIEDSLIEAYFKNERNREIRII